MKWLIYKHTNIVNGKVYIGQTRKSPKERWRNGKAYICNPTTRFAQAIIKYGWDSFSHEIVESDLDSQQMANERERFWISQYDSYNYQFGYNMTLGGTDIPLAYLEKAQKVKKKNRREKLDMIFCWELTKIFPNPIIALEWFVRNGYENNYKHTNPIYRVLDVENRTCFGFHFCRVIKMFSFKPTIKEETNKDKGHRRKVVCINTGDVYDSLSDCGRILGIKTQHLSKACKKHVPTHHFYFAYLEDYDKGVWEKYVHDRKVPKTAKAVYCFELDTSWSTMNACCEELGISTGELSRLLSDQESSNIYKTIQGKHFCFVYERDNAKIGKKPPRKDSRPIYCIETQTQYNSITEAQKELHIYNILKCCKNWKYTSGGFHWCFLEDKDQYCDTPKKSLRKKVRCIETGEIFASQSEACRKIHRDFSSLNEAIKNKTRCAGYHWEQLDN